MPHNAANHNAAKDHSVAWDTELFVLRGANRAELLQQIDALKAELRGGTADLPRLARSINSDLDSGSHRICLVAANSDELLDRLERASERLADPRCRQIKEVRGIYYFDEPLYPDGKIALLFPAEGSQYQGMLDGLADHFPIVRDIFEIGDQQAADFNTDQRPISRFTVSPDRLSAAEVSQYAQELRRLDNAFFSVFIANWAVFALLEQMGLQPSAAAGHSGGELAALVLAGVFDPQENIATLRGTMQELVGRDDSGSALLAVAASRDALSEVIQSALGSDSTARACIAMDNCPHQTIAVGDAQAIATVEAAAREAGLFGERIELGRPYHTRWFESYMSQLRALFDQVQFHRPRLPVYSCTTGERFPEDPDAIRELTLQGWCSTVEFTRLVRNLHRDGVRIFVEVGPRNNLTSFVNDILSGETHAAIPSNTPHRSAVAQLHHLAAELAAHHVPLSLDCLYEGRVDSPQELSIKPPSTANAASAAAVVRQHLAVSEQFLDVQNEVMQQFLHRRGAQRSVGRGSGPAATPRRLPPTPTTTAERPDGWLPMVRDVVTFEPGRQLVARRTLDVMEDHYAAHHTLGGRSISRVDPTQHGLPVMPMTFTLEIMMEAAARLIPDLTVTGLQDVRMSKWLAFYEEDPCDIEVTATLLTKTRAASGQSTPESSERRVLVEVKDLGRQSEQQDGQSWLAAVGTVILSDSYAEPPAAPEFLLAGERPCGTDVPTTYNNLFHGELLQGFRSVERFGDDGIEGIVCTLPRDRLFRSIGAPRFVADPVLLDVAMHPVVAWHLEQADQAGRIMLPFELGRLELFGPMPPVGAQLVSQTRIVEGTHWQYTHDIDLVDQTGRLWSRIVGVKLWRFYLPFHDVNFHGPKDIYFLAEKWPEANPWEANQSPADTATCCCVRLKELSDLQHPALQLAAARVMLSPTELKQFLSLERPDDKKAEWLFGRAAAKDAIRFMRRSRDDQRLFMADVEIFTDDLGRPYARPRGEESVGEFPNISIAHTAGHIVAIAAEGSRVGIDVEIISHRDDGFLNIAFDDQERELLSECDDRDEWVTRFWCAKEAAGKALGCGLAGDPRSLAVCGLDPAAGIVEVGPGQHAAAAPDLQDGPLGVTTRRDGDLVVATTLAQRLAESSSSLREEL